MFLGDELTAAGYRLAGADVRIIRPDDAGPALTAARTEGYPLILMTAECAEGVAESRLYDALAAVSPQLLLVPDAAGRVPVPDFAVYVRQRLGVGP